MPHSKYPSRISQNQSDNFSTNSKLRNRNVHLTRRQVCALWLHILRYVTLCCQGSPDNGWSFMSSPVWVWKVCVCVSFFSALIGWVIGWCICLIDWWVCWWIDWLVSCLVVWLLGEFDWLIESFSFMDFFFGWIHWLIGFCSIFWLVDCSQHYEWFHETPCVQNHFRELFAHWSTRKRMGLNVHLTCKRFLYFTFNQREMYLPIPSNETTYPSESSIKDSNENQPQKVRQETNIKSWARLSFWHFSSPFTSSWAFFVWTGLGSVWIRPAGRWKWKLQSTPTGDLIEWPENKSLEKEIPFRNRHIQVPC